MQKKVNQYVRVSILAAPVLLSLCSTSWANPPSPPSDIAPVISGTPPSTSTAGTYYSFTPTASDADSSNLTFSIINKPSWATFATATGTLSGTPTPGSYNDIQISVGDGTFTTLLSSFSINVASSGGTGTSVPVMEGWWLLPGVLAGVGIFARRRKNA
ncbi:putative Ig domain-containing protein [Geomonas anaerohicana]|uniref:Dystroglycan-type cadherin-like domain-containing protein n=1 Tax=Geomonas anaerohicana TaxID=2798583 RepID=A0ABS0Y9Z0_9BACT|nr:putative Ig domain-containing protein [Geomonas anaerohicana]MBJ6749131.1 hypothetical protein [Geomonas anaerohicana]